MGGGSGWKAGVNKAGHMFVRVWWEMPQRTGIYKPIAKGMCHSVVVRIQMQDFAGIRRIDFDVAGSCGHTLSGLAA